MKCRGEVWGAIKFRVSLLLLLFFMCMLLVKVN
jgi:hypothetical protein